MAANRRNQSKPASLTVQIRDAERQLLDRRRLVRVRGTALGQNIYKQMTTPASLLLGGGVGFVTGELTPRQTTPSRSTDDSPGSYRAFFETALNLITLLRPLFSAPPLAGVQPSTQPDAPGQAAPPPSRSPAAPSPGASEGQGEPGVKESIQPT
jgi:hypothetical protein